MQNKDVPYQRSLAMIETGATDTISMEQKEKPDAIGTKVEDTGGKDKEAARKRDSPWKPTVLGDGTQEHRRDSAGQDVWAVFT